MKMTTKFIWLRPVTQPFQNEPTATRMEFFAMRLEVNTMPCEVLTKYRAAYTGQRSWPHKDFDTMDEAKAWLRKNWEKVVSDPVIHHPGTGDKVTKFPATVTLPKSLEPKSA